MANPDKNQDSSFSLLNVIIILIAVITVGYIAYTYFNPQVDGKNTRTDYFDNLLGDTPEVVTQEVPDTTTTEASPLVVEEDKPITFFNEKSTNTDVAPEVVVDENSEKLTPVLLIDTTEDIEDNDTDVLQASDQRIYSTLAEFSQQTAAVRALLHDDMLRNTVVFVENFSKGYFISKFSPMTAPEKKFTSRRQGRNLIIDPRSYQRYDDYADYIYSVDSKAFVQYYLSLKPSIDDFYAEIARPNTTFDDALDKAIAVVMATPVIYKEIEVNSPSVMYLYNDPALENLNDAQKLLLRMGPQNLAKIKHKLRSIQAELAIAKN